MESGSPTLKYNKNCGSTTFLRFSDFFRRNSRSNHRCSIIKGVLRIFTKFTGKHLCQSFFFNKVAGLRPATLLKKRLWHRCFPVNFAKFLKTPFLRNTCGCFWNDPLTKYGRISTVIGISLKRQRNDNSSATTNKRAI